MEGSYGGTSDMSDVSIAKFAIYTITVPAGAEAGSYELKVTGWMLPKTIPPSG